MTVNDEMTVGILRDGLAGDNRVAAALFRARRRIAALTRRLHEKRRGDGRPPPETSDAGDIYNDPALWLLMIH